MELIKFSIVASLQGISIESVYRWIRQIKEATKISKVNIKPNIDNSAIKTLETEKKLLSEKDLEIAILKDLLKNKSTITYKVIL